MFPWTPPVPREGVTSAQGIVPPRPGGLSTCCATGGRPDPNDPAWPASPQTERRAGSVGPPAAPGNSSIASFVRRQASKRIASSRARGPTVSVATIGRPPFQLVFFASCAGRLRDPCRARLVRRRGPRVELLRGHDPFVDQAPSPRPAPSPGSRRRAAGISPCPAVRRTKEIVSHCVARRPAPSRCSARTGG